MIRYVQGDLLQADAEALVNAVNCRGIMGKGIALQFKLAYPDNFKHYEQACKMKRVVPGQMFVVPVQAADNPRYIINFPTKRHWRDKSRLEDIQSGLAAFAKALRQYQITSVAVPALGCGLGGLDWNTVKPLIEATAEELPDVTFLIYSPGANSGS